MDKNEHIVHKIDSFDTEDGCSKRNDVYESEEGASDEDLIRAWKTGSTSRTSSSETGRKVAATQAEQ